MTATKPELKRCPFCGGECVIDEVSIYIDDYETWFKAGCPECHTWGDAKEKIEYSAKQWNTRATQWRLIDENTPKLVPIIVGRASIRTECNTGEFPSYSAEAFWCPEKGAFCFEGFGSTGKTEFDRPTHWQPLPSPPDDV